MKAFITKYALSKIGIVEVNDAEEVGDGMLQTKRFSMAYFHREGKDWHRTRDDAVVRANEMREKKIAALRKQISKLEATKFSWYKA